MGWVTCPICQKYTPDYKLNCIGCGTDLEAARLSAGGALKPAGDSVHSSSDSVNTNMIVTFIVGAIIVVALLGMFRGCKGSGTMNVAEFRTLSECLEKIERNSGESLRVVTDTADEVSGKLSGGGFFSCERIRSGTKGTYYEATYSK